MSADTVCANCGEEENLRGSRDGEVITVTCQECGLVWDRDLTPKCPVCGSVDVRVAFQSILEKSRGTQLSIQSMRLVHLCPVCDKDRLAEYIKSNTPLPPDELPVTPRD
jgi:RNA polymerase subunit RPABC4/transcription elongation factor Spt4